MTGARAWFLARHPVTSVVLALAVVTAVAVGTVRVLEHTLAPGRTDVTSSPRPFAELPSATETLDERHGEPAHRALHSLGRACRRKPAPRRQGVEQPLRAIVRFVARHPSAQFPVDDEAGSTLTLLFVVRDELLTCAPSLVGGIDRLIPEPYRPSRGSAG